MVNELRIKYIVTTTGFRIKADDLIQTIQPMLHKNEYCVDFKNSKTHQCLSVFCRGSSMILLDSKNDNVEFYPIKISHFERIAQKCEIHGIPVIDIEE